MIPVKLYVYAALIIALTGLWIYERQHLINEGKAECRAELKAALERQLTEDARISKQATGDLNAEIERLRAIANTAPVRVFNKPCGVFVAKAPARASDSSPPGRIVPEVPEGTGDGLDLGRDLQRLALDADIVSARYRTLLEWENHKE
jgi:hypothetical protein